MCYHVYISALCTARRERALLPSMASLFSLFCVLTLVLVIIKFNLHTRRKDCPFAELRRFFSHIQRSGLACRWGNEEPV